MGNPSTIWAQLSMPNPPAGSVPYVDTDGVTIVTDVVNFSYDPVGKQLNVTNLGLTNPINHSYTGMVTPAISFTSTTPTGRLLIPAAQKVFTLTNPLINAQTIALITLESNDTTALYVHCVQPTAGQVVITLSANTTAIATLSYVLVN